MVTITDCSNLNSYETIGGCYSQRAIETGNVSECDRLNEKNEHFVAVVSNELKEVPDLNLSTAIEMARINCYAEFSFHAKNLSLCTDNFQNESLTFCVLKYALSEDNVSVCLQLPAKERDECYGAFAMDKNDSSYCNGLTERVDRLVCYMAFAQTENDTSVCDKLPNPDEQSLCRNYLNGSICDLYPTAEEQDKCRKQLT